MLTRRQRVLQLAGEINRLREKLTELEAEFDALVPDGSAEASSRKALSTQPATGLGERVLGVLTSAGREVTMRELLADGGINSNVKTMSSVLHRLSKAGRVVKVARGVYRAA